MLKYLYLLGVYCVLIIEVFVFLYLCVCLIKIVGIILFYVNEDYMDYEIIG